MSVIIETTLGDITIDLFLKERPRTCLNFLKLCKVKYYNFCLFHSVQRNFVAQTGDPTGAGRGGESIFQTLYGDQAKYFDAEVVPKIKHREIGTVSMVNDGNGQHGSQFLITLGESLDYLDGVHSVFGQVAEGMDVLMKINETFCDKENRPFRDIRITHTVILDDPLDDPPGLQIPDRSPEPTAEQLKSLLRIGADEELDDTKGLTEHEVVEKEETVEAEHRAQVLAIIGDLPDKDVKPPDNVLFVCKLNPVTTDEDLEIIFTRFGTIVSCEIIRDFKSGESLQYAFIEFSNPEECEKAYLKMDNVLIDDRRIHVDFSQSVSRMDYRRSNNPKLRNDESKGEDRKEQSDSRSNRTKRDRRRDDDRSRRRSQEKYNRHSSSRSRDDSSRRRAPTSNYHRTDRDFERSASPNRTRDRRIDRRDDSRSEHSEKTRLKHARRRRDSSDSDKSSEGKSRGKRNRDKIAGDRKGRHESELRSSNSKIEKKQSRRERSKSASSSSEDSSSSNDESLSAKKRSRSKGKKARSPSTDSDRFESRAKQSGNKSRKRRSRSSSADMKYKSKSSSKRKNRERSSSSSDSERERHSRLSKKKKR